MSIGLTADDIFFDYLRNVDLSEDTKNLIADAIVANNERLERDLKELIKTELKNK